MEGAKRKAFWIGMTVVVAAAPFLGMETYTAQILTLAGIYATVALGLGLVLGNAGQISLGQAAFFGIGAYVTAQLMLKAGISFVIAFAAGGCLAGLTGASLGYLALRFHGHYLAMVTLCFGLIMQIFFLEVPALTGGAAGITDIPSPQLFGSAVENSPGSWCKTFHLAWFLFLGMAWFLSNILSLQTGRALAALRDNPIAAESLGLNVSKHKVQAFAVSAVLAGLAGGVYSVHTHYIGPEIFGVGASLEFLIMVVVGGLGRPMGAVAGALLLTVIPEFIRAYEEYRLLIFSVVLMAVVLVAPEGLWGLIVAAYRRIAGRLSRESEKPE
ncbi:MAG: branched-chain amino acid ABC transporter permease [Pseudomonadota bacterium]